MSCVSWQGRCWELCRPACSERRRLKRLLVSRFCVSSFVRDVSGGLCNDFHNLFGELSLSCPERVCGKTNSLMHTCMEVSCMHVLLYMHA